jgi:molybdopterin converting factor small subunit
MQITVKLFATFRTGRFKVEQRDYPAGTTVGEVVAGLGIDEKELGTVMVNSRHAGVGQVLNEGDALAIFPLVGGG